MCSASVLYKLLIVERWIGCLLRCIRWPLLLLLQGADYKKVDACGDSALSLAKKKPWYAWDLIDIGLHGTVAVSNEPSIETFSMPCSYWWRLRLSHHTCCAPVPAAMAVFESSQPRNGCGMYFLCLF